MRPMPELKVETVSIDELNQNQLNSKLHPAEQIDQIAASIEQFGNCDPIGVWTNDDGELVIVEGHGRYAALRKLGITDVPIIRLDHLTDEQRRAYGLVHNKLTMNSDFDVELLANELDMVVDIDMSQFDFDVTKDFEELPKTYRVEEDDVPDDAPSLVSLGDVWQLGRHRLMCGDSTDPESVARLMGGMHAKILFTSPPYADLRDYNGGKELHELSLAKFIGAYRPHVDYQCVNLGIKICNYEIVQYWDEYIAKAKEAGYKLMAWNVWDKTMAGSIGQQRAFFPTRHEWVFVFGTEFLRTNETWDKKAASIRDSSRKRTPRRDRDGRTNRFTSVGDASRPFKRMESVVSICSETGSIRSKHPAVFPVTLPSEYIKAMTDEHDLVVDPFGGSGTTMIAAEQLGRTAYLMELDPSYCDVIIERWQNLTGDKAVKVSS